MTTMHVNAEDDKKLKINNNVSLQFTVYNSSTCHTLPVLELVLHRVSKKTVPVLFV